MIMYIILGILTLGLFFGFFGLLIWWQYTMYKDYERRFGYLFKDDSKK